MEPLALKDHDKESRVFFARVLVAFSLAVLLMILLVVRLFYLQIIQHGNILYAVRPKSYTSSAFTPNARTHI